MGSTALTCESSEGLNAAVDFLLEAGANIEAKNVVL